MLGVMNGYRSMSIRELLLKLGGLAVSLVFALFTTLRDLLIAAESRRQDDRSIQDSDLIGDYNSRTQQFDSGNDPVGWYEDEA